MKAMFLAFRAGEDETSGEFDAFADKFIEIKPPKNDKQKDFLLTVDIFGMFFSVFSAPFFNNRK